jgi:uncharacterized protein DUF4430
MYNASLAIDNVLTPQAVALQAELTARELVEAVFVQLQTDQNPDPFKFTISYYGYDHYQGVTSYLGYFIVSINQYVTGATNYWDLYVNGKASMVGMDSYLVQPNDQIELKWITVPASGQGVAARVQRVQARRAQKG